MVRSEAIEGASPTSIVSLDDHVLELRKQIALKFFESSSPKFKKLQNDGTPDTSAEKRERQDEWETWPLKSLEEGFSWWSRKNKLLNSPKGAHETEDQMDGLIVPSPSVLEGRVENSSPNQNFRNDVTYQEPRFISDRISTRSFSQEATDQHVLSATHNSMTLEPVSPFTIGRHNDALAGEFAGTYPPELYNTPSSSSSVPISGHQIGLAAQSEEYVSSIGVDKAPENQSTQALTSNPQPRNSPPKKIVSETVRKILDRNSGWF
ncbi:hypothetical protein ABW20_dc0109964 [Dactylellina cionopaga]|nr:hypothetical protein ABW20_dc0109964 [Dactylellina cionopaga]